MNTYEQNRTAWNSLADQSSPFAKVATDQECAQPLVQLDSRGWLPGSVKGLKVLCLAAGGGWQSILYAAAGADVTVVDLSPSMLRLDAREAERRGYTLKLVEGSMDDLSMLEAESFDIVHQPVSTCYVPRIEAVFAQVSRVLKDRGIYISQHKTPTSLQVVDNDSQHRYLIGVSYYVGDDPLPDVNDIAYREVGTREYLHRWEELVGGLCRAGFVIEDLVEPKRGNPEAKPGNFRHRGMFVAPYVRMKARRIADRGTMNRGTPAIWTPE